MNRFARPLRALSLLALPLIIVLGTCPLLAADDTAGEAKPPSGEQIDRAIQRGIEFLRNRGQADNGAFSPETGAAVTGLCVRAILEHRPRAVSDPVVQKALKYIESNIQSDGGIYRTGSRYRNYETSVSVGALLKANRDGRYDSQLRRAEAFLKEIQWDEGEGHRVVGNCLWRRGIRQTPASGSFEHFLSD